MNIIFIMADQLPAKFIGCYGSGVDSSPTLDKLAEEGMRFTRNYASCPVCAPNRATILTGRSPVVHGVIKNNYELKPDTPTYAHMLRDNGYVVGGFGKFHQTPMMEPLPDNLDYLGFHQTVLSEDPKWGPWLTWIKDNYPDRYDEALSLAWPVPYITNPDDDIKDLYKQWKEAVNNISLPLKEKMDSHLMFDSPISSDMHDTKFITDKSLEFIESHLDNSNEVPFFCHISYVDPHDPYDPPAPYNAMYNPNDMPEALPSEWKEQGPDVFEEMYDERYKSILDDSYNIKKMRALYHGSIRMIDDQITRVVNLIKEKGLWQDTIFIFTTDHGDMLGDHGLITKGYKHYDLGIRCPLIISGGKVNSGVVDHLSCSLDIFPSICDFADIDKESLPPLEGISLRDYCEATDTRDSRDAIQVAYGMTTSIITKDGWRLTRFTEANQGQMFNLMDDPDEQQNLYNDPRYFNKKMTLFERLTDLSRVANMTPQYRNMPEKGGEKYYPHHNGGIRYESSIKIVT